MNETVVTVVGNVVAAVDRRRLADGTAVANFRVVSTQRRYDRSAGGWVDGDKLYIDVTCWRELAENVAASLTKGDPVVVTGRLYTRSFEHDGRRRWTVTLEAQNVGPDLGRCTAVVSRTRRRAAGDADDAARPSGGDGPSDEPEGAPAVAAAALVGALPGGEG